MLSAIELRTISMIVLGGAVYLCLWFAKDIKLVLGILLIVSCSNLLLDSYVLYLDSILALSPRPIIEAIDSTRASVTGSRLKTPKSLRVSGSMGGIHSF